MIWTGSFGDVLPIQFLYNASVAQLDRALVYEARGRWFDSIRVRQQMGDFMKRLALTALLLANACAATGAPYTEHIDPHSGDIVVYRISELMAFTPYSIDVNGAPACNLDRGGFFVVHRNGAVTISASMFASPGTSRLSVVTSKGTTRYARIGLNDDKRWATAGAGFIGALIAEGASGKSGPFDIELVDPSVAKQELIGLKEDCPPT